jgi:hypothetical protein
MRRRVVSGDVTSKEAFGRERKKIGWPRCKQVCRIANAEDCFVD